MRASMGELAGSAGMSWQLPSTENFQPWYTQRRPPSSLRANTSGAPRCGQAWSTSPTRPALSRNATRSSPSRRTRYGCPSLATSLDSRNGSQ